MAWATARPARMRVASLSRTLGEANRRSPKVSSCLGPSSTEVGGLNCGSLPAQSLSCRHPHFPCHAQHRQLDVWALGELSTCRAWECMSHSVVHRGPQLA